MTYRNLILLLLFVLSVSACKSKKRENIPVSVIPVDSIRLLNRAIDVEPSLEEADSIQVLFYTNPDGDPKRYSRFFTYTTVTDSETVEKFKYNLRTVYSEYDNPMNCRSEGKAYLFGRKDVIKTIYFSTRCDSCCYIYFIKDGRFFYVKISEELKSVLRKLKKSSREPRPGQVREVNQ
ncbi:MAG: hypothetical protein N2747_08840 [Chitinophagaceae bacterium]|nr:hypothetical protein [Chitinophagaceae bacterium]